MSNEPKSWAWSVYRYFGLLNEKGEPSGHKLTALALTALLAYAHKGIEPDNRFNIIIADQVAIMLLLGRVTFEQILKLKNGDKGNGKSDV